LPVLGGGYSATKSENCVSPFNLLIAAPALRSGRAMGWTHFEENKKLNKINKEQPYFTGQLQTSTRISTMADRDLNP